ncbi:MAG: SH3 domain-containing protein [Polyangiaceae bacterium]|nr:SH3 domain-containing protein [Myxococcales bacterium]MCB9589677.1 SH3 domain-containing protein [Polyangiaceae bacterium]
MSSQVVPPDPSSPAFLRLNRFLAMTASDRGPLADFLHLAGIVALVGSALSLAIAVIWFGVRSPAAEPPRLPPAQFQSSLDPQDPVPKIELPAAAPVSSAAEQSASPPEKEKAEPEAKAEEAAVATDDSAAKKPTLPPGFFQSPRAMVHEVFGTATDKEPYLALRSRPAREANLLGKLDDGTQLKVINRFGKWQFVQVLDGKLKGTEGFVYGKYVRPFGSDFR